MKQTMKAERCRVELAGSSAQLANGHGDSPPPPTRAITRPPHSILAEPPSPVDPPCLEADQGP